MAFLRHFRAIQQREYQHLHQKSHERGQSLRPTVLLARIGAGDNQKIGRLPATACSILAMAAARSITSRPAIWPHISALAGLQADAAAPAASYCATVSPISPKPVSASAINGVCRKSVRLLTREPYPPPTKSHYRAWPAGWQRRHNRLSKACQSHARRQGAPTDRHKCPAQ